MSFNSKRKAERLNSGLPDFITTNVYNLLIGAVVLYGIVLNAVMVVTCREFFLRMNLYVLLIGYFVLCLVGVFITRSRNPFVSFIGYNLVVVPIGAVLSVCVPFYDTRAILAAIIATACVVTAMLLLSTAFPRLFANLGIALFVSLLLSVIAEFIATFVFGYGGDLFNWIFVVLFSLYIGFDWYRAQRYPKTIDNAVDSALDIYLDVINLFLRLLQIFGRSDD